MKAAIGCEPNATGLKEIIKRHLNDLDYEWEDYGSNDPIYVNVAIKVPEAVASGKHRARYFDLWHGYWYVHLCK